MSTVSHHSSQEQVRCAICGNLFALSKTRDARVLRPSIVKIIVSDGHEWDDSKRICLDDLRQYRSRYVENLLEEERGELSRLDQEVIESFETGSLMVDNSGTQMDVKLSFGDRAADRVASFGGSWTFILSFCFMIAVWMTLNITSWFFQPFDLYPFILLNLVLSCVAALQAPIIMMSQRRVEAKDRLRAESDYKVNLKAELEIRQIHDKIDHQLARQWEKLMEIQQIQMDMLTEPNNR